MWFMRYIREVQRLHENMMLATLNDRLDYTDLILRILIKKQAKHPILFWIAIKFR